MRRIEGTLALALTAALTAAPAYGGAPASPPPAAQDVDIEEHLGQPVDRALAFTDMNGRRLTLGDALGAGKPVVLVLAYYRCPMLCGLVLQGAASGLSGLSYRLGDAYRAVTVSFDPRDTPDAARRKRESTLAALPAPAGPDDWPFLVGGARETRALADAVGFRYAFDPRTDQYAHPAALVVLTPDGRVSRYLYGVAWSPRDLRMALLEAGEGKIGTILDRVIMTCYRYDPASRAYAPFVTGFLRLGGALILLTVAGTVAAALLADRRRRAPARAGGRP